MAGGSSHGAGSSSGGAGKRDDEPPVEFTDDMMELLCMQRPPVAQNKNSFTIASETLKIAYLKGESVRRSCTYLGRSAHAITRKQADSCRETLECRSRGSPSPEKKGRSML